MKVTIITACYNNADTIKRTIESVRAQTYTDIEHIFVDGASRDNTVEVIRSLLPEARLVSEPDKGIYDALNKGIARAGGDVIGMLHADDFYAEETVISDVVALMKESKADALYGDLLYVDRNNTEKIIRNWKSGKYTKGAFRWGWMPPHPTFFVRRELYDRYGKFNLELRSAADYELMLRFIHKHQVRLVYLEKVMVKMRTGGQSNVSFSNRIKANKEDQRAWAINDMKPFWFTRYLKPMRKILQYVKKGL